ncbi:hypothetical protein MMC07_006771 [Pseudocyphellaria aurata]|nr:hypothetical protein [Pseudocyphellaria aurata]
MVVQDPPPFTNMWDQNSKYLQNILAVLIPGDVSSLAWDAFRLPANADNKQLRFHRPYLAHFRREPHPLFRITLNQYLRVMLYEYSRLERPSKRSATKEEYGFSPSDLEKNPNPNTSRSTKWVGRITLAGLLPSLDTRMEAPLPLDGLGMSFVVFVAVGTTNYYKNNGI